MALPLPVIVIEFVAVFVPQTFSLPEIRGIEVRGVVLLKYFDIDKNTHFL